MRHLRTLAAAMLAALSLMPAIAQAANPAEGAPSPAILNTLLGNIEDNNRTLQALRSGNEAIRLGNLTGLSLDDPEVAFSYMWGVNRDVANKINIEVTQSFDFATLSGAKRRLADRQNDLLPLQYRTEALAIMLQAREAIVNITYYNALIELYSSREKEYDSLCQLSQSAYDRGAMTIMDFNSIKMHHYALQNDIRMAGIERETVQNELNLLNGGNLVSYPYVRYCPDSIPPSFAAWYAEIAERNPELQTLASQIGVDAATIELAYKEGLPTFSVGYTGEIVTQESLHGFAVGLSLPLWSNKGKVKAAEAARAASQAAYEDAVYRFLFEMKTQYERTAALEQLAEQYQQMVELSDNTPHLQKALKAGQMTMIDYVTETDTFTEMQAKALEAWRDYHLSLARLLIY